LRNIATHSNNFLLKKKHEQLTDSRRIWMAR